MQDGAGAILLILIAVAVIWIGLNPNLAEALGMVSKQKLEVQPQTALDILQKQYQILDKITGKDSGN